MYRYVVAGQSFTVMQFVVESLDSRCASFCILDPSSVVKALCAEAAAILFS